ncbi:MAG: cupredoxin domain-containing protein, partial [Longimicrobiales bacterium]
MMRRIAAVLTAVMLAAGCGDADRMPDDDAAIVPNDTPLPGDPEGGVGPGTLPPDDASVRNVAATLTEWSVTLSQDSVPAGAIAFNVSNTGTVTHRFEVEGNGEEWETEDVAPGTDVTMSVSLSPGTYKVYCPIEAGGVN